MTLDGFEEAEEEGVAAAALVLVDVERGPIFVVCEDPEDDVTVALVVVACKDRRIRVPTGTEK
jgi:hypothetical protein